MTNPLLIPALVHTMFAYTPQVVEQNKRRSEGGSVEVFVDETVAIVTPDGFRGLLDAVERVTGKRKGFHLHVYHWLRVGRSKYS